MECPRFVFQAVTTPKFCMGCIKGGEHVAVDLCVQQVTLEGFHGAYLCGMLKYCCCFAVEELWRGAFVQSV